MYELSPTGIVPDNSKDVSLVSTAGHTLWLNHKEGSHLGAVIDRLKNLPRNGMVELQLDGYCVQVYNLGNSRDHIDDGKVIGIIARNPVDPLVPIILVEFTYDEGDRWSYRLLDR